MDPGDKIIVAESRPAPASRYVYEPITASTQIRLIQFSKSQSPKHDIDLSLHTFALYDDKCPNYAALSYVWGSSELSKEIHISGRTLPITESLYEVLCALRPDEQADFTNIATKRRQYRYYWIDAICIDQENLPERGEQVPLMRDIYSRSICTVVWLGGEYENSGQAMNLIRELGGPGTTSRPMETVQESISNPRNKPAWKALHQLFCRPYWRRAWIRQEYVLSQKMTALCADHWCEGTTIQNMLFCLARALNFYDGIPNLHQYLSQEGTHEQLIMGAPGYEEAKAGREMRLELNTLKLRLPLLAILDKSKGLISTNPRDRIYGVLGLANDGQLLCPKPDYTATVSTVYADFAKAQVREYENLDVICFGRPNRVEKDLPSWVPDWSGQAYGSSCMASQWVREQQYEELVAIGRDRATDVPAPYRASLDIRPQVEFSADLTLLSANGLLIGTIDGLGYYYKDGIKYELIQSCAASNLTNSESCDASRLRENMARSLLCGRYSLQYFPETFYEAFDEITLRAIHDIDDRYSHFLGWFRENSSLMVGGRSMRDWVIEWTANYPPPSASTAKSSNARMYTLDAAATNHYYHKRPMTTIDGGFGMAPYDSKPGDQVWILFGCSVPVVLRECGEKYILVGECYIDDFMDGKAVEEYLSGERMRRTVILR